MLSLDDIAGNFKNEIDGMPDSKEKVLKIIEFATNYFDTIGDRCQPFYEEALTISKKLNYAGGEAMALLNRAFLHFVSNDVSSIGDSLKRATELAEELKAFPDEYTYVLNLFAYSHWFQGQFDKGFDKIYESFKMADRVVDKRAVAWMHYALGVFYFDTKDLISSEQGYQKAMEIFTEYGYEYGRARSMNGIGSVRIRQGRAADAVPYLEEAAVLYKKGSFYSGLARSLTDLALIEKAGKNYDKSIALLGESLEIRKHINHTQGLITTYSELGEIYILLNNTPEAMRNLEEGLSLSEAIGAKYKSIRLHKLLSDAYKSIDDIKNSFAHFEKYHHMKEAVLSEESANNIRNMQTKYERERSDLIEIQKTLLEEKQKEILDSIRYAKRIQNSLMPTEKYIDKNIKRLKGEE
ncbi:MAG: tetratricopeptide repeat protein [Bacteroidia bacterium]